MSRSARGLRLGRWPGVTGYVTGRLRDRLGFLWGWVYRFEAYTPAAKRKLGYYALPLLWLDRVIGWANLSVTNGRLAPEFEA